MVGSIEISFILLYTMVVRYRKRTNFWKVDEVNAFTPPWWVYWYFMWWYSDNYSLKAYQITFSTWVTAASTVSNLSVARYGIACLTDKVLYWYTCWGTSWLETKVVDRTTLSTWATAANTASNLSIGRQQNRWLSDWTIYWYVSWWYTGAWGNTTATDRITFSTSGTAANTVSNLSLLRKGMGNVSDWATYGYFCWWSSTAVFSNTGDRITFSTSATSANTASNLSTNRDTIWWLSDSVAYGYFLWWYINNTSTVTNVTDRITFSTSATAANTVSNLTVNRGDMATTSDWVTYGYYAGWDTWWYNASNLWYRMTYSTWAFAASTVSNLVSATRVIQWFADYAI